MNTKSIQKMQRANKTALCPDKLQRGLKRFETFCNSTVEFIVAHEKTLDERFLTRLQMWHETKHGMICRIGETQEESKAKVGLAIPLKRFNLAE